MSLVNSEKCGRTHITMCEYTEFQMFSCVFYIHCTHMHTIIILTLDIIACLFGKSAISSDPFTDNKTLNMVSGLCTLFVQE